MTETRQPVICACCKGKGYVLWVYPERKPRPAYWFNRGPNGERPRECDCQSSIATRRPWKIPSAHRSFCQNVRAILERETYFARCRADGSVETVEEYVARIESELRRSKSENHGDAQ